MAALPLPTSPAAAARPLAVRGPRAPGDGTPHPVHLCGLRRGTRAPAVPPLLVERRDQDFVQGLLDDLADPAQHAALAQPARQDGTPRLFPPLQRVFNLLVLEAFCDTPGQPRLDPAKIDSSGFVLRRVDGARHLAWLKAGSKVFGWEAVDEDMDPAQERRARAVSLGHPLLDALAPSQRRVRTAGSARLAASNAAVSEDVQPLFVAPPQVCAGAGRTLLFGSLRVVSSELTEAPSAPPAFGTDADERAALRADMVSYLLEGGARSFPVPGLRTVSTEQVRQAAQTPADAAQQGALRRAEYDALERTLGLLLLQLNNQYDAFGAGSGAVALQRALAALQVEEDVPAAAGQPARVERRGALDFLREAKAVFIDGTPGASVRIPNRWGAVDGATAASIFEASLQCMQQQFARLQPASGRFDKGRNGSEPRYVVRAFVRLKPEHEGCPGRLLWSPYSEAFTIAPWFESAGAPVPVIPLPDLMDRAQLRRVKPTVAFALPPKLAHLLRQDAKALRDGDGKDGGGSGLGLGWICSFSLPIITLCAFIVLNIFLTLFNLIFWWLPFLKICIPIPKAKE
ncbi:hypothetical protein [Azohydromonas aeria]|uniref:hypothetical protein n=1 Tax=Azohydromonas aeria TaxID=2590212 RepID=UPI0012FA0950|nr:hypothetical protein [Azohydromonas aeria]